MKIYEVVANRKRPRDIYYENNMRRINDGQTVIGMCPQKQGFRNTKCVSGVSNRCHICKSKDSRELFKE